MPQKLKEGKSPFKHSLKEGFELTELVPGDANITPNSEVQKLLVEDLDRSINQHWNQILNRYIYPEFIRSCSFIHRRTPIKYNPPTQMVHGKHGIFERVLSCFQEGNNFSYMFKIIPLRPQQLSWWEFTVGAKHGAGYFTLSFLQGILHSSIFPRK